ncbi:hypothetical protein [Xanthomonas medicagonis]|uniref:hypothetical protein n=1 Tax=Xanthomonas medicagonis TaxID=3160841 RepID=UPI003517595C
MRSSPNPNAAPATRDGHRRRTLRIAVERIEARFGAGNLDDACDALIALLRTCCGDQGYRVATELDTHHPNPWFHRLLLHLDDGPADLPPRAGAVAGIADSSYRAFVREVAALGLAADAD